MTMDENDILTPQEEQEFTLEDILREFGSGSDETIHDELPPELLEDMPLRELLGILENAPLSPVPSPRTEEYYRVRPCARFIYEMARLTEEELNRGKE